MSTRLTLAALCALLSAYLARPSSAAARPPSCALIMRDARWLTSLYVKVSRGEYRPTPAKCRRITRDVNRRFHARWEEARGLPSLEAEPRPRSRVTAAARTLANTCTSIALDFACEGILGVSRRLGVEGGAALEREFFAFVLELRVACKATRNRTK